MGYYYSPFRNTYKKPTEDTCPFCNTSRLAAQAIASPECGIFENEHYLWVINTYPKFEGHTMLVPRRHVTELGSESVTEIAARESLLQEAVRVLRKAFPQSGIEVFAQSGEGSEASIKHLHWHVVPSQPHDPIRGFEKLGHYFTVERNKARVVLFPTEITYSPEALLQHLAKHGDYQ